MRSLFYVALIGSMTVSAPAAAGGSTSARTTIVASVDVKPRASIVQSTEVLRFQVTDPDRPAEAVLTFAAGARAAASSEVLLIVTAEEPLEIAGGPTEIGLTVSSDADRRAVTAGERMVAAQWTGGGRRSGQLRFLLRAAEGVYTVPVKLQLIVP